MDIGACLYQRHQSENIDLYLVSSTLLESKTCTLFLHQSNKWRSLVLNHGLVHGLNKPPLWIRANSCYNVSYVLYMHMNISRIVIQNLFIRILFWKTMIHWSIVAKIKSRDNVMHIFRTIHFCNFFRPNLKKKDLNGPFYFYNFYVYMTNQRLKKNQI